MKALLLLFVVLSGTSGFCQYDGAALTPGSLAIHKDSVAIIGWANNCQVERGWLDTLAIKPLGLASQGLDGYGAGAADGSLVVSLGDSGVATLAFNPSIANGPGPDFAVFENSFSDNFLELAFWQVSSNGVDFFRFPAVSNYPTDVQIGPFDDICDPTMLYNLAGKYRSSFGTPFDLQELDTILGLDVNQITHVRIVDVVGSISPSFGSTDINGNLINDPFPTPFESSGFDLDAIGVIHQGPVSVEDLSSLEINIFPNPVAEGSHINIQSAGKIESIIIHTISGTKVFEGAEKELHSVRINQGAYLLIVNTNQGSFTEKLIVE